MRPRRQLISVVSTIAVFSLTLLAWNQRQAIFDWSRIRNYQAPAVISQLATDTTMNSSTRRLFYVYHPELDDKQNFSNHCPDQGEKTIVLGCYISQRGIYLYNVSDPRLAGVQQVTAAHETLHAAYDRLSPSEKNYVNALINQAYDELTDERIRSTIEDYRKAGADTTNELHSILGTEVRNLPPELEAYYARYFTDRKKIVSYSENYEKVFTDRDNQAMSLLDQINKIEAQLPGLKNDVDTLEISLATEFQSLEKDRKTTTDPSGFNARVAAYNNEVAVYKGKVSTYNSLVKQHNDLLGQYNAIALEENELIKALDSHPSNAQTQ